jgi:hypothetical protein
VLRVSRRPEGHAEGGGAEGGQVRAGGHHLKNLRRGYAMTGSVGLLLGKHLLAML